MPTQTFALDVYGTLIDTTGVLKTLEQMIGSRSKEFSYLWREKQLEYSFRRGLMNKYVDFSIVTKEALEYCCLSLNLTFNESQKRELMDSYKTLPAFEDAMEGVVNLKERGHRIFAYSNGSRNVVNNLLKKAKILNLLDGIVSMEDVKMFKPSPIGYAHFNQSTNSKPENSWMVSGNNFDVIGGLAYGMNGVWLKRNPAAIYDPLGFEPSLIVEKLTDLAEAFTEKN